MQSQFYLNPPSASTNHEGAATSAAHVEGDGEPDNRWGCRFIQGSCTLRLVEYVVEDEQRLVVAHIDDRADKDRQSNGGRATFN